MRIAVLGTGHIGSTVGRLWHAAGHEITFAAQHAAEPQALAAELGTAHTQPPCPARWPPLTSSWWPSPAPPLRTCFQLRVA
jgi:NADP oxidoreductase coenzyme F420-dependent